MKITFPLIRYRYNIYGTSNYIGAGRSEKKPLTGEDWLRGRDLKDGRLRLLTILGILSDILASEFRLGRFRTWPQN